MDWIKTLAERKRICEQADGKRLVEAVFSFFVLTTGWRAAAGWQKG